MLAVVVRQAELSFIFIKFQSCYLSNDRSVNSFSTRLSSSCTDEYAHTYDISTY